VRISCRIVPLLFGVLQLCLVRVEAVVVAGANGGGDSTNNTTSAQMAAQLSLSNADFFNNVVPYSDATAVYIGWADDGGGPTAYALSAMHINFANTISLGGVTYDVTRQMVSGSDLAVLSLTQVNDIMPTIGVAVPLASSSATADTPLIMAGNGRDRTQPATTSASVSDAVVVTGGTGYTTDSDHLIRWGTNNAATFAGGNTTSTTFYPGNTVGKTVFTEPAANDWLVTNEAQAANGDSGGAVFSLTGSLFGIMVGVTDPSAGGTEAFFGQATAFMDIATYKSSIEAITGTSLIPEPSAVALSAVGLLAGAGILRRGRRCLLCC